MPGYTLTEMLVVVAIIGLISAVVIPQTIGQLGKAQNRTAKQVRLRVAAWEGPIPSRRRLRDRCDGPDSSTQCTSLAQPLRSNTLSVKVIYRRLVPPL